MELGRCSGGQKGFTLVEVMVVVAIIGIMATIAIPSFIRYQVKSRQAEARSTLGGIFVSQTAHFATESTYDDFNRIGFDLAGTSNRYTYRLRPAGGAGLQINAATGPVRPEVAGCTPSGLPAAPSAQFTATAVGNLDGDPTDDQWYVNDLRVGLEKINQPPTCDDVHF